MIDTVKKIYVAQDLPGEAWVQPLKRYNKMFPKPIEASPGLLNRALFFTKIFLQIIAYSILGPTAAMGMLIKLTGAREVSNHNRAKKSELELCLQFIQSNENVYRTDESKDISANWKRVCVHEANVSKENLAEAKTGIEKEIDNQTAQYKKIYLVTTGIIHKSKGSITVQVEILEKA